MEWKTTSALPNSDLILDGLAHEVQCVTESCDVFGRRVSGSIPCDDGLECRPHDTQVIERAERRVVRDEGREHGLVDHLP